MENKVNKSIRKYIRKLINESVSAAGTVFGPYSDEVTLSKSKMPNPQYFSIAIDKANKICSNPEKTQDKLDCPYNYEIEKTIHAKERQFRHVGNTIEDEQIKYVINKASDKIVTKLLSNAIKVGDKIHLKDIKTDLNVIISIESEKISKNETIIIFPIVTVINKRNFIRGYDTKITIPV
jgi:hypothetical protein